MKFRVIIRTPNGMVRGICGPQTFFAAANFCRFMRSRGHRAELVSNDRSWDRQAAELAAKFPTTLELFPGNDPVAITEGGDQGACNGK